VWSAGQRSMARFNIGDTVFVEDRRAKVVWLSENANEFEAMDEYIVESEDKRRQFVIGGTLAPEESQPVHNRRRDGDARHPQTH
jgi:hypothetical protein